MEARRLVEMALAHERMSNAALARELGWSPQLLNKRLNTGKFTVEEWEMIGKAIGADRPVVSFHFQDGTTIQGVVDDAGK